MKALLPRIVLGVVAGVIVYAGFTVWANAKAVAAALATFHWSMAVLGLGLASLNYLIRFGRWQYYLRYLRVEVAWRDSFMVFFSGFALTVTPGKMGEAVKAFLLRETHGVPAARTAPIVVAERVTDLLALVLLALVGVFTFAVDRRFLALAGAVIGVGVAVLASETLAGRIFDVLERVPWLGKAAPKLREFHSTTASLLRPRPLVAATLVATASWFTECLAFYVVVHGFAGAAITLRAATFIYAAMTIAGALTFVPGGLGVTEAGMLGLLVSLGTGLDRGTAAAATFVTRVVTLWFAVALGLPAFALYARRAPTLEAMGAKTEAGTATE